MSKKIAKLATSLAFLSTPAIALAQGTAATISISEPKTGVTNISTLINSGFQLAILVAIIFVFAMLIWGGYGWLTAGGDKGKVEEARTRITNALIGMAIVASAFALITIVGKFFGVSVTDIEIPSAAN